MTTFLICLALLIGAYFIYGRFWERECEIDRNAPMPSQTKYDGVDYIPMPRWRTFMIQLLNIAGLGPFFGAVLGAAYGPVAFLWITLGTIIIGSVHDFVAGVISIKSGGLSLPEIVAEHLGERTRHLMRIFSVLLMVIVGAVFMSQPAKLIAARMSSSALNVEAFTLFDTYSWLLVLLIGIILLYYIIATLLPIDKIIGKFYPLFSIAMLFSAFGVLIVLFFDGEYTIPELTSLENMKSDATNFPIIPMLCATISCGAISGFHATQSPLMARCLRNEKEARPVFFGSMIMEGIIALIWAAMAMSFWGSVEGLNNYINQTGGQAAIMIDEISRTLFNPVVASVIVVGIVACAITSGDTAFRSARLIVADFMHIEQKSLIKRIYVCLPLFLLGLIFVFCLPFQIAWYTMAWTNQLLAVITLWAITAYLAKKRKRYLLTMLPAMFMTFITVSYIFVAKHMICLHNHLWAYIIAGAVTTLITALMINKIRKNR